VLIVLVVKCPPKSKLQEQLDALTAEKNQASEMLPGSEWHATRTNLSLKEILGSQVGLLLMK